MGTELAKVVLGSLILRPSLIESSDLLTVDLFASPRERRTFEIITEIYENRRPEEIDSILLASKVGGDGASLFIANLTNGVQRLTNEMFVGRVLELRELIVIRRLTKRLQKEVSSELKTGAPMDLAEVLQDVEELRWLRQPKDLNVHEHLISGTALQALELETSWAVEKLVPARSITVLHSPGGLGKTWFSLGLANAVSQGLPFLGLATKQRPVCYLDFENPLPLLIDRARKLDIREVVFWHLSASVPPPRLDTAEHRLYRQLPAGSLIVFDTLRAAHDGDENSSQDMALVMGRLKELRELGFDIFLIHHSPKANERLYKGSTTISDLADHVLKLYRSRRGSLEELQDDGEPDPDATFVLATGKTRFEPFHLYLTFNSEAGGFSVAEDPNLEALEALAGYIAGPGRGLNQSDLIEWAKDSLGGGRRERFIALLRRGEREGRWRSHRGFKGAKLYEPLS